VRGKHGLIRLIDIFGNSRSVGLLRKMPDELFARCGLSRITSDSVEGSNEGRKGRKKGDRGADAGSEEFVGEGGSDFFETLFDGCEVGEMSAHIVAFDEPSVLKAGEKVRFEHNTFIAVDRDELFPNGRGS